MDAMGLDTLTYSKTVATSSVSITFTDADTFNSSVIIYNEGSTAVFALSGTTAAPTAVYPTDGSTLAGKVIAPGATMLYQKGMNDKYLSLIRGSGTGLVHVAVGTGE